MEKKNSKPQNSYLLPALLGALFLVLAGAVWVAASGRPQSYEMRVVRWEGERLLCLDEGGNDYLLSEEQIKPHVSPEELQEGVRLRVTGRKRDVDLAESFEEIEKITVRQPDGEAAVSARAESKLWLMRQS